MHPTPILFARVQRLWVFLPNVTLEVYIDTDVGLIVRRIIFDLERSLHFVRRVAFVPSVCVTLPVYDVCASQM